MLYAERGRLVLHDVAYSPCLTGRAVPSRAAEELRGQLERVGLTIRAGIHTGEIDLRGEDVAGIAVHLGARVMAEAGPGEIPVSLTVRGLVAGSGIGFANRGTHSLKGIKGERQLFAVELPAIA